MRNAGQISTFILTGYVTRLVYIYILLHCKWCFMIAYMGIVQNYKS